MGRETKRLKGAQTCLRRRPLCVVDEGVLQRWVVCVLLHGLGREELPSELVLDERTRHHERQPGGTL